MSENVFRVIPVLDVKDNMAVHAVGGIRSHYRPLRSVLHPSCQPVELARAYRDVLGFREMYLADLDAIGGREPNHSLYGELAELGLKVWVDAGVKTVDDLDVMIENQRITPVVGLETVAGPHALEVILKRAGAQRVVFSLDLFHGVPRMSATAGWDAVDQGGLCRQIIDLGVRRVLILELSRVGTGQGTGTDAGRAALRASDQDLEIAVGGGISGIDEIHQLRGQDVTAVLVGSALHDGRIGREELVGLRGGP
jgi:phosphoribosylformimino-5-aminoimidazole carboxamide ribotide isomerase